MLLCCGGLALAACKTADASPAPRAPAVPDVEGLVRKIAAGDVPAARYIDPALGVLEWRVMPGGREEPAPDVKQQHCADAANSATTFIHRMVERERQMKETSSISCRETFATTADLDFGADEHGDKPAYALPTKHASCWSNGAGEYDAVYRIVWQPDATRGMRIAAIVATEQGAINKTLAADLSVALGHPKSCPTLKKTKRTEVTLQGAR